MIQEVAMFLDLENLRYSLLNLYGQEPDFGKLIEKAKKYGRPSVMKAYADFQEHPTEINRQLQIVGIEAIHTPVKRNIYRRGNQEVERIKNASDMGLALDAIMEAIETDHNQKEKVFIIVAGDRDYVKLVTILRNRFGIRVIVVGVPGAVSTDLVTAAGESDLIEIKTNPSADSETIKKAIVEMIKKGPSPLTYWTVKIVDQWSQNDKQSIPGTPKERRDAIHELLDDGVLRRQSRDDVFRGQVIEVVLDEEMVLEKGMN